MSTQIRPSAAATERRRYKRYIVTGTVTLHGAAGEGVLMNLGRGGLLVRTDARPPIGTDLALRFQIRGNPETFDALGQVAGSKVGLTAIKFLEEPAGIDTLLCCLEQDNCMWSGVA